MSYELGGDTFFFSIAFSSNQSYFFGKSLKEEYSFFEFHRHPLCCFHGFSYFILCIFFLSTREIFMPSIPGPPILCSMYGLWNPPDLMASIFNCGQFLGSQIRNVCSFFYDIFLKLEVSNSLNYKGKGSSSHIHYQKCHRSSNPRPPIYKSRSFFIELNLVGKILCSSKNYSMGGWLIEPY